MNKIGQIVMILGIVACLSGCSGSEVSREVTKNEVQVAIDRKIKAIDDDVTLSAEQKRIAKERIANPSSSAVAPSGQAIDLQSVPKK
jgi:PBP1b-binding outer membrane lipoprotein LpoB